MWIIAGPNGAGKSSFAGQFLEDLGHRTLDKLNADERTLALRRRFPAVAQNDLNLQAAQEIDREVEEHIAAKHSFVVETVLSSQRVSERAAKGGHDVEAAKAIEWHGRSHRELSWFAPHADVFMAFDNSAPDGKPVLVASRVSGRAFKHLHRGLNPSLDAALQAAFPARVRRPRLTPGGSS
jgi:predicted ABC-type ATPase